MNRPFIKTSVVAIVSLVLLYYSVAWAVLRCFHDEHQINSEVILSDVDRHDKDFFLSSPSHAHAYLDCMGPEYHIESLAESSSLSKLQRLTVNITSHGNEFLRWQNVAEEHATVLWLRALFDRVSPPIWPFQSPRYLSLSTLRI
jgi:hypothetical protein